MDVQRIPREAVKRPSGPSTVIKGGLLIDGTGKAPIPNSVVVIEGGTIKAVGALGQVTIPSRAQIIEAKNKIVLPGLIDMHVHYRDWMDQLFISHGVTTVRDVGRHFGLYPSSKETEPQRRSEKAADLYLRAIS